MHECLNFTSNTESILLYQTTIIHHYQITINSTYWHGGKNDVIDVFTCLPIGYAVVRRVSVAHNTCFMHVFGNVRLLCLKKSENELLLPISILNPEIMLSLKYA